MYTCVYMFHYTYKCVHLHVVHEDCKYMDTLPVSEHYQQVAAAPFRAACNARIEI